MRQGIGRASSATSGSPKRRVAGCRHSGHVPVTFFTPSTVGARSSDGRDGGSGLMSSGLLRSGGGGGYRIPVAVVRTSWWLRLCGLGPPGGRRGPTPHSAERHAGPVRHLGVGSTVPPCPAPTGRSPASCRSRYTRSVDPRFTVTFGKGHANVVATQTWILRIMMHGLSTLSGSASRWHVRGRLLRLSGGISLDIMVRAFGPHRDSQTGPSWGSDLHQPGRSDTTCPAGRLANRTQWTNEPVLRDEQVLGSVRAR